MSSFSKAMSVLFASALLLGISGARTANAETPKPKRTVLQKQDIGTTGREGTLALVEFAPGAAEVPHTHPGEYFAYVLEGSFSFDLEGKTTVYSAGDSFMVGAGQVHSGKNVAKGTTKLLITFILEKGKPASTPVKPQ